MRNKKPKSQFYPIYKLDNIRKLSIENNPVKYSKIIGGSKWRTHKIENNFTIELSNDVRITIKKGFKWDRSSVPQLLWGLLRPDGDDDIAYLIHDYLYHYKGMLKGGIFYTRKWADKEMLKWAKAMKKTKKWSLRNIDIYTRYYAVRLFGWFVWNKD